MTNTYILHVDGDNFFASCLVAKYPKYKNKALVVGAERGMATALSNEAKALGVTRGMPIFEIKEKYKDVIILTADYDYFLEVSKRMHSVIEGFTKMVEKYSIDESFADITEIVKKRNSTPEIIGREIKDKIQKSLGINFSVGVAPTKTLAKLTSTSSKPNGFRVAIASEEIDTLLKNSEIEKVWGIGRKSATKLRVRGIYSAYDLKYLKRNLVHQFGKPIMDIQNELKGCIINKINLSHPLEHTMISSQSFQVTDNVTFIRREFVRHIHILAERLRRNNAAADRMTIYIKNKNQEIIGHTSTFLEHTDCISVLLSEFDKNFERVCKHNEKVRTVGVHLENIIQSSNINTSLFNNNDDEENLIYGTIDTLSKRGLKVFTGSLL